MRTRSSTAKRLLKLITGITAMTLCAATSVFAVPPNTAIIAAFQNEILTPASQAGNAWKNVAPNALADYYTYQPLTNADALLAGFPAICGDKRILTGPDSTSTADCYIISARQFVQPLSLNFLNLPGVSAVSGTNAFPGPGLIQGDGFTPFADATTVATLQASATAGNLTTGWGYGSGGNGWRPYYQAAGSLGAGLPAAAVPGPTLARGNAPAAFAATPINLFLDNTYGDPTATGIWHFPAPSLKGTGGATPRPVLVYWQNSLPNVKPVGLDPSVDCGDNAPFCYPYNRTVVHVHGAHVGPESDGLAVAWSTPNFALEGEGAFKTGAVYNYTYTIAQNAAATVPANLVGKPINFYPMTQEAGTIWYHDHGVGTTHNNVDMGLAGFFPITDAVETGLRTPTASVPATVPALLPVLPSGTGSKYELGLAFQDRNFDINGQIIMPTIATYNKNDPNCVFDINNNALPGTCARLDWMKKIDANTAANPSPAVHLVPYNATTLAGWATSDPASYALNFPALCQVNLTNTFENVAGVDPVTGARIPFVQCAPFPATSSTLEYFGNMPMVNGVTYAVMDVEPTIYRMRLLGGSDSRSWIAQLVSQNGLGTPASPFTNAIPSMMNCGGGAAPAGCAVYDPANIVPFFQIGSEQGLLGSMVQRSEVDLMDGERVDVLVDFSKYAGQTITMKNLADDAPYSGRFNFDTIATRMPTSVDIPEIMKFRVGKVTVPAATPSAQTPVAGKALKTVSVVGAPVKTRTIALIEITDQYGRTMPTIDGRGYVPPGIRTTEVIQQNTIEQWDIVNTTVDAHPMHLHQVAFQAINRQAIALIPGAVGGNTASPTGFMAGANFTFGAELTNCTTVACRQASIFTPSQYAAIGVAIPVAVYDAGPKDTIQAPPGYVTRVKALFDLVGDYVWHCHILSHEEHDMMRPFRVTSTLPLAAPTSVTFGAVANGRVTVTVLPAPVAPIQAVVQYKQVGAPFWTTSGSATSVQTVNLDAVGPGTFQFQAQYMQPALQNVHSNTAPDSNFTAAVGTAVYAGVTITSATPLPSYTLGSGAFAPITLTATGGVAPYTWALAAGSTLPPGLVMSTAGVISGTPNLAGAYTFSITVSDFPDLITPVPITDTKVFTMTVSALQALAITTPTTLPAANVGTATSVTFTTVGGIGVKTWAAPAFFPLPAGFTLNSATGVLNGTPTATGTLLFAIQVTDSAVPAVTTTGIFSMTVGSVAPVVITTTSPLTPYTLGSGVYTVSLVATGGAVPYNWAVPAVPVGNSLPAGLTLSAAGVLSGTPTVIAGTYTFTLQVTDSQAIPVVTTKVFTLVVNPAVVIPTPTSVTLTPVPASPQLKGTQVTFTAAAAGGSGTYQYQFWYRLSTAGSPWIVAQPYGAAATWVWNTTPVGVVPGTYFIEVDAISVGGTTRVANVGTFVIQ